MNAPSPLVGTIDRDGSHRYATALVLLWSHDEPERVGEVAVLPAGGAGTGFTLGRANEAYEDGSSPLTLRRLRPHAAEDRGPFRSAHVSRWQIRLERGPGDELSVEAIGQGELRINDHPLDHAMVRPGDTIEAVGRFVLQVTRRPIDWPRGGPWPDAFALGLRPDAFALGLRPDAFAFGAADRCGFVGESPAAWHLRRQVEFLARRDDHVLVTGPTGAGKELMVRAIHAGSSRGGRPLIARNAATIPESVVDAELFGNVANYPNPGVPERGGLLGEADGTSLLLDEIGELPPRLQARLMRVMDGGEYQRLGEAGTRAAQVRILATTNRDPGELRRDFLARFPHRLAVPGFAERPEDVVLVARHLLRGFAARDPSLAERYFADGQPRMSARLVCALTRHRYTAEVRELALVLWRSIADSPGSELDVPPDFVIRTPPAPVAVEATDPRGLTREQIVAALARVGGVRDRAWRELGLRSRDQLKRLLKKHDIS